MITTAKISICFDDYPRYEHLVLFPSSKKTITSKEALSLHNLLRFINENSNIFVVGGSQSVLPDGLRGFLNELGVFPSPKITSTLIISTAKMVSSN